MEAISIVKKLGESEFSRKLNQIFEDLPKKLYVELDEAQDRYMHLIGITSGSFSDEMLKQDRARFGRFVRKSDNGSDIFFDDDCSEFMSTIYGLPALLCRMFIANDFNWTVASGFIDDESAVEESNKVLSNYLRNHDEMQDIIQFFMQREMLDKAILTEN